MDAIARAVEACQKGSLEGLGQAMCDGVLPNDLDHDGCSLLHWAAINNRVPVVERLLQMGADPNILGGILMSSPLHWSARVGHLASSALLVKGGATCNVRDTQGYTPIHLAVQSNQASLVAYLLEKFDYCRDSTDNSGMTPAMWAAYRTFNMFPIRLIVQSGSDLNAREHLSGNTALHIATQERNYAALRELLLGGADVSIRNKQQETPIDIAKNMRNQRLINMLSEAIDEKNSMPCCLYLPSKKMKHIFQFFLPGLFFGFTATLFQSLHYGVAAAILLIIFILSQFIVRFEMHTLPSSLIPIGVCVAEPICMLITWFYYLHWYVPWWLQIIYLITILILGASLLRIVFADPGVIQRPMDSHEAYVRSVEANESINYCFTCWVNKISGAKHCAVCDRCVLEFDHHCPWLHQCITRRNLREFIIFVFCVAVSAAIYSVASLQLVVGEIREYHFNYVLNNRSWLLFTLCITILHVIMLSVLFVTQCIQISEGTTTHDRIKNYRRGQLRLHETNIDSFVKSDFRYHHGEITFVDRVRNIFEFCGGYQ